MARKHRKALSAIAFCMALAVAAYSAWRAKEDTKIELSRQKELNEVIATVLDSYDVGYAIADEHGNIIEWNPALERMSGWSEAEIRRDGMQGMLYGEGMADHFSAFAAAMERPIDPSRVVSVYCVLPNRDREKPGTRVRVTVRVLQAANGHKFAVAHIDKTEELKIIRHPDQGSEKK